MGPQVIASSRFTVSSYEGFPGNAGLSGNLATYLGSPTFLLHKETGACELQPTGCCPSLDSPRDKNGS